VANTDAGTIQKFTSGGIGSVFAGGMNRPFGLAAVVISKSLNSEAVQ
jgi:hypothetical protein